MPRSITCLSCKARLALPEKAVGKRLRCPRCGSLVPIESEPLEIAEPEEDWVENLPGSTRPRRPAEEKRKGRPAAGPNRDPDEDEEEVYVARRHRRKEEPEEVEEITKARDKRRPARPGKKKKRKGKPQKRDRDDTDHGVWAWSIYGGGAVVLAMLSFFGVAVLSDSSEFKFYAIYLLISVPASTVLFFVAMYLSSIIFGAMEMGNLRVAVVKAFILLIFVNMASLVQGQVGAFVTLPVWIIGLLGLFRLDMWEAGILLFMNWLLNYGLRFLLMGIVLQSLMRGDG
jgi:hypothetical protein